MPTPTATPTSPAFSSLDGTWEVQLQYIDHTDYSYFVLREGSAGGLTGQWRVDKNSYPLTGSYDGRLIKLAVTTPTATVAFNGYVEAAQDMVGETDYNDKAGQETPWTAEHRGKAPEPHPTHRKGRLG